MTVRMWRVGVVVLALAGVSACGAIPTGDVFKKEFWKESPLVENNEAELGLADLGKGNYVNAEGHFTTALDKNPKDVEALLGLGMLYQNTGQTTKARTMYESVLALRPDDTHRYIVLKDLNTRPVSEIASVNLALMESGGVLKGLGRGAAGQKPASFQPPDLVRQPHGGASAPMRSSGSMVKPKSSSMAASTIASAGPANILSRFETMAALRDQGLITQEEYAVRRQTNVGALLPLTSPPPAAGLDRPVPTTEQISGRLRAIGRALEMRAITISQHTSERSMILDALMPAAPVVVANPGVPPQGLLQAADAVRQLEVLRDEGVLSSDEYSKERTAIEHAMQPPPPKPVAMPASMTPAGAAHKGESSGPQPAVHLASYRSKKAADAGWARIKSRYKSLIGKLDGEITKINLGRGKGIYWRLKVGPLGAKKEAANLCRKLKRKGQRYCEPSIMGGG